MDKATCYRGLQALCRAGLLRRDGNKYRLGFKLLELAASLRASILPTKVARPIMERLRDATGQSVQLVVRDGTRGVYLDVVESKSAVRLYVSPGRRPPLYAGASTRLLFAFLPPAEREVILKSPLEAFTPRTITDPAKLESVSSLIRQTWFAISFGELEPFTAELAVPLLGAEGEVVAALSVAGVDRAFLDPQRLRFFVEQLDAAAKELSAQFGFFGAWKSDPETFLRVMEAFSAPLALDVPEGP